MSQKTKIVNLTPHWIDINGYDRIMSSGCVRAEVETTKAGEINGIPIFHKEYKTPVMMPQRSENTIYIVSNIVCYVCPERDDFYLASEQVKSPRGFTFTCKGLSKNPYFESID